MAASPCTLLFTKAARPGRVKTRLIGDLSAAQTARLHSAFVDDVLAALRPGSFHLAVAWADDEPSSTPPSSMAGLEIVAQHGDDLGQRLYNGLRQMSRRHDLVAAVGSDHPEIDAVTVEGAFRRLRGGADVVLGPVEDGGYFLIALRREALHRQLFEGIPWSTATVCRDTLERCAALGLRCELLASGHDIDVAADFEALVRRLQGSTRCGHTRELLREWGYLP